MEILESLNFFLNNNGGNYLINNYLNGMSSDVLVFIFGEEVKLKKELEDVEKVKKIVDEYKDVFVVFYI